MPGEFQTTKNRILRGRLSLRAVSENQMLSRVQRRRLHQFPPAPRQMHDMQCNALIEVAINQLNKYLLDDDLVPIPSESREEKTRKPLLLAPG